MDKLMCVFLATALFGNISGQMSSNESLPNLDDLIADLFKESISPTLDEHNNTITATLQPPEESTGNKSCICIPYYQCDKNGIITDGTGLIDIRSKADPFEQGPLSGYGAEDSGVSCDNYLEVCCRISYIMEEDAPAPPANVPYDCGRRNPEGVGFKIVGDSNVAQFGEFPWMVGVLQKVAPGNNLNIYRCGGSLIHPQMVLTAAHCVTGKDKMFKIRAGEWDTENNNELYAHQDRDVKSVTIHPKYYPGALFNDVALLLLEDPLVIAENVDVVCLPPQDFILESSKCFTSGWGKDLFGRNGVYQFILKKIHLEIVDRNNCSDSLRNSRLGKYFKLHRSFICAGGEKGKDACYGDAGGPLVCPVPGQKDRYMQTGIVAWGLGCAQYDVPGVYANVALFRNWINEQMTNNKLNTSVYSYYS